VEVYAVSGGTGETETCSCMDAGGAAAMRGVTSETSGTELEKNLGGSILKRLFVTLRNVVIGRCWVFWEARSGGIKNFMLPT